MHEPFVTSPWQKLPAQVMQELASRERQLRKNRGLSQIDLSDASGVSLGSLRRFENTGQISLESLLKLAFVLEGLEEFDTLFHAKNLPKSLDDLLSGTPKP